MHNLNQGVRCVTVGNLKVLFCQVFDFQFNSASLKTGQPLCSAFSATSESAASDFASKMSEIHTKCRFPNDYIYRTKDGATRR